jgi:esterase/lipase
MQQQVISAGKRQEKKEQRLHKLQDKRGVLERDLLAKQAEGIIKVPNASQISQYVKNLKTKNENLKKLQAEVGGVRKELAVMLLPQAIVQAHRRWSTNRSSAWRGCGA